jgi:hypothetical protein
MVVEFLKLLPVGSAGSSIFISVGFCMADSVFNSNI